MADRACGQWAGLHGVASLPGRWLGVGALALALAACGGTPEPAEEVPGEASELRDITIAGEGVYPESITSDAAGNIYNGGMDGTIYRTLAGGDTAVPWIEPDETNELASLFGVLADDDRSLLWVCSNQDMFADPAQAPDQPDPALKAFDLTSGELAGSHAFPLGQPVICNDIAIARDGVTFATETMSGRIFSLSGVGGELELFAEGEELVGVDGIAFADDGTMYINNVREHLLQRVERDADGAYAGLTDLAASQAMDGPDGLRALGGNRFIQAEGQSGRVTLITIEGDSAELTTISDELDSAPAVTRVGNVAYVPEGKIGYLVDPELQGQDPGEFIIRAFALPEGS